MSTKSEAVIGQVGQLHTPIRLLGVIWSIGKKKRNLFDIGVIRIYNALPALKKLRYILRNLQDHSFDTF